MILDWDDFLVHQEKRKENSSRDHGFICSHLTNILKDTDEAIDSVEVMTQERNTSNLYFETETLIRLKVTLKLKELKNVNGYDIKRLLKNLFPRNGLRGVFSLDGSCEELLYPKRALQGTVSQYMYLKSFKLGTMVGVGNFVSFFDSEQIHPRQLEFCQLKCDFRHDLASLHVLFYDSLPVEEPVRDDNGDIIGFHVSNKYELKVKYETIHSLIMLPSDNFLEVFLVLKCPPLLYKKPFFTEDELNKMYGSCREKTFFMRKIPGKEKIFKFYGNSFGKSNVLSLKMPLAGSSPWNIMSTMKRFMDFSTPIPFYLGNISLVNQAKTLSRYCLSSLENDAQEVFLPDFVLTNFNLYYAVQCCFSLNYQFFADLTLPRKKEDGTEGMDWNSFWVIVEEKFKEFPESVERTFYEIFHSLERNSFIRVLKDFPIIFEKKRQETSRIEMHNLLLKEKNILKIRRAVLTPTRMIFMPPHPVVASRLLQECELEFAMRVQIRDDDGSMLSFTLGQGSSDDKQMSFLRSCIKRPILEGFPVGPIRKYEFLGTTTAQLREHGLILYSKDSQGRRAKDIRETMGDFSKIRCVGKHIARVGQTLSQMLSKIIIQSDVVLVKPVDDVRRGRHPVSKKGYNFTDGIGKISITLARRLAETLGLGPDEVPSAFQIRYKGFKGMVVVDPFLPPHDALILRKSMDKFASDTNSLEILKISKPRAVYLNRPLICLLDQLGTDLKILDKLLGDSLKPVAQSLLNEAVARETLLQNCSFLYSLLDMESVSAAGISVLSDPFMRKVLEIVLRKNLRELKEKARIKIPFDSGRMMFGVVDEYGVLEYGQVFIQYSTGYSETGTDFVKGDVMVTRNPCMHPGDIRMLKAVCNDKVRRHFKHIKDCIVFPQKGHRPHPNEMGGGDLDGDEYAVIWMKDLFITKNVQPMDFSDEPAVELDEDVQDHHQLDFICNFIQANSVGFIARAWLAVADLSVKGVFDPQCLELCARYSTALDFTKTGRNDRLPLDQRPEHVPDFFEKGAEKYTYKSDRILGILFNRVRLFELALNDSLYGDEDTTKDWKLNPDFIHPNWKEYEEVALADYSYYESRITSLMKELSIDSEESLLSLVLERNTRFFSGRKDATDLQELLERLVQIEFHSFRKRFEEFGDQKQVHFDDWMKKASAYYHVSHQMSHKTLGLTLKTNDTQKKLFGFHWIASRELSLMVKQKKDLMSDFAVFSRKGNEPAKDRVTTLLDQFVLTKVTSKDWDKNVYDDDPKDMVMTKILRCWIIRHPIHMLRMKFDDEALVVLMKTFVDAAYSSLKSNQEKDITHGSLIMESLEKLMAKFIEMPAAGDERNDESSTNLLQLGLAAIMTYNRMLQTSSIYSVVGGATSLRLPGAENNMKQYHISLVLSPRFVMMVQKFPNYVLSYLQKKSEVTDIAGRIVFQGNYKYWMVTAIGNKWQLDTLNNIVIQRNFFKATVKGVNRRLLEDNLDTF